MTVHLVNLTNPMMMKGPFREFIPVDANVRINIPLQFKVENIKLLVSGKKPDFEIVENVVLLKVSEITDHEIIGIDLNY